MGNKQKGQGPQTGNDFIELAAGRGAEIIRRGLHTKIRVKGKGATYVIPGDKKLDKRTISNLRKWFRLLGLMGILWALWWIPQYLSLV